jgi:hypothetical protein
MCYDNHHIHQSQYGYLLGNKDSLVPGRAFIEEMQNNNLQASQKTQIKADLDAMSCFDHILFLTFASLLNLFGVAKKEKIII